MKIAKESHLDHGLSPAVIDYIATRFEGKGEFFIETFELPASLGTVPCNLHGPEVGEPEVTEEEAQYAARGDRAWPSRLCARPQAFVRTVTVIGGPHEGECILYTAYGGPCAPREPGDPNLPPEELEKSKTFWGKHALGGETHV